MRLPLQDAVNLCLRGPEAKMNIIDSLDIVEGHNRRSLAMLLSHAPTLLEVWGQHGHRGQEGPVKGLHCRNVRIMDLYTSQNPFRKLGDVPFSFSWADLGGAHRKISTLQLPSYEESALHHNFLKKSAEV